MDDSSLTEHAVSNRCTSCGVHRNRGDRCEYCGAIYPDMVVKGAPERKLRSLDGKYRVNQLRDRTEIVWDWKSRKMLFLIPFFIFWNMAVFSFVSLSEFLANPLSIFPIPGVHMAVGIFGAFYVLALFLNKTTISAGKRHLEIAHHPIPWPGGHRIATDEIEQIFVSRERRSSKNHSWDVPALQLLTNDGRREVLMKGNTELDFGDYETLRRHLLKAMDIEPRDVVGAN